MNAERFSRVRRIGAGVLVAVAGLAWAPAARAQFAFGPNTDNPPFSVTITGYAGPGGIVDVPEIVGGFWTVTRIGDGVFMDNLTLTEVRMADTIRGIGANAFRNCAALTRVEFGAGLGEIGDAAFLNCIALQQLTTPPGLILIRPSAFEGCAGLTDVVLSDTVRGIEEQAFRGCAALARVWFGNQLATIGEMAFHGTALTSVVLPDTVTTIGISSFGNCTQLLSIAVGAGNPMYSTVDGVLFNKTRTDLLQYPSAKPGAYAIPAGVVNVGTTAFVQCTGLTSVSFPDSVTRISGGAFAGCPGLTRVTLGSRVAFIGTEAFVDCAALTTVALPDRLALIEDWAFASCPVLTGLYFAGDAPTLGGPDVFKFSGAATVYRLATAQGWPGVPATWGGRPTALYVPRIAVTPSRREVGRTGGRTSFSVANAGEGIVRWRASETSAWLRITNGVAGTNAGTVRIFCTPNRGRSARTGLVTFRVTGATGARRVKIMQGGRVVPLLSVTPETCAVGFAGGDKVFAVANKGSGRLNWRASETSAWLRIVGRRSGTGRGTVVLRCDPNDSASARSARVRFTAAGANGAPRIVQVSQSAAATP